MAINMRAEHATMNTCLATLLHIQQTNHALRQTIIGMVLLLSFVPSAKQGHILLHHVTKAMLFALNVQAAFTVHDKKM
jgi:hypothetical protein